MPQTKLEKLRELIADDGLNNLLPIANELGFIYADAEETGDTNRVLTEEEQQRILQKIDEVPTVKDRYMKTTTDQDHMHSDLVGEGESVTALFTDEDPATQQKIDEMLQKVEEVREKIRKFLEEKFKTTTLGDLSDLLPEKIHEIKKELSEINIEIHQEGSERPKLNIQ